MRLDMTTEEALAEASTLLESAEHNLTAYQALNRHYSLGLQFVDSSLLYSIAEGIADDQGWNTSYC